MLRNYFYGYLEERMLKEPPEAEWIAGLYRDIKQRLLAILPDDSEFNQNVEQSLDVDLFKQMVEHNALDARDLIKISNYTFTKVLELCHPYRDSDVEGRRRMVEEYIKGDNHIRKCISLYIHYINISLDELFEDMEDSAPIPPQSEYC